jgi:hypothetical protein
MLETVSLQRRSIKAHQKVPSRTYSRLDTSAIARGRADKFAKSSWNCSEPNILQNHFWCRDGDYKIEINNINGVYDPTKRDRSHIRQQQQVHTTATFLFILYLKSGWLRK